MARTNINTSAVFRVVTDLLILATGGITLILFSNIGVPFKRGFFCDDQSLQHPYIPSTVTSTMLYGIGFSVALIVIISMETYMVLKNKRKIFTSNRCVQSKLAVIIRNCYLSLVPFFFGAEMEHIILDIAKYSVGRLRPHFFDVCKINVSSLKCDNGYIEDFVCDTDDEYKLHEVRLSFPSGHTSYSSYVAVYLMIYLQYKMTFWRPYLLRPVLQVGLFFLSWYTALSRISDYKHHPTDIIGGAVIGVVIGILVSLKVAHLKVAEETKEEDEFTIATSVDIETSQDECQHLPSFTDI